MTSVNKEFETLHGKEPLDRVSKNSIYHMKLKYFTDGFNASSNLLQAKINELEENLQKLQSSNKKLKDTNQKISAKYRVEIEIGLRLQAQLADLTLKSKNTELPITEEEIAALKRFHECVSDGEGYDVPKDMMQKLAEIGLIRRVTKDIYEHTLLGLHILEDNSNE